mmetsp:Transcript_11512/g.36585  ORF Transcript_11512/g.36585 Transcript_11512/m.36585 type:complete len:278 (+) Transcript_11512:1553-2386(+)
MSCASVGRAERTVRNSGWGLPRQKLERVQVALRSMESLEFSWSCWRSGPMAPSRRTRSRQLGESPAMFPSAQTACSRTSSFGEVRSRQKIGTAPSWMTTRVWSDVPDAMFVSAQAASNWSAGESSFCRNWTSRGTTPASITIWIGGFRSIDSSLRNCVVASRCTVGSALCTPDTRCGNCSSFWTTAASICCEACDPPGIAVAVRLFCSRSSFLFLRIWIVVSSRLRRASSWSTPFLYVCFRAVRSMFPGIIALIFTRTRPGGFGEAPCAHSLRQACV